VAKPDFQPLLQPGMHRLTVQEHHILAVAPFSLDPRRQELHDKFCAWAQELEAIGLGGTLWLAGSFLTGKPSPADIDCVLWNPHWVNAGVNLTPAMQAQASRLLDHATAGHIYGLDLYVEFPAPNDAFHREAYWRGVLGFGHDRVTTKGFAEVIL